MTKRLKKRRINCKKVCRGSISIFLCLILSPVLTLASALIEYSRYQNAVQITKEAIDVSTVATLSNYDSYLNDRFGLFALSQDPEILVNDSFSEYLEINSSAMGKAIEIDDVTAKGVYNLTNNDILKQQILDFGESTALTDSLLRDLNIEDILNKLDESEFVTSMEDVTGKLETLTGSIETVVETAETLKNALTDIVTYGNGVKNAATNLSNSIKEFKDDLAADDIKIVKNEDGTYKFTGLDEEYEDSEEGLLEAGKKIVNDYSEDIENIINDAITLKSSLTDFKDHLSDISDKFEDLKTAVSDAESSLSDLTSDETQTADEKAATKASTDVYQTIIDKMNNAISAAANSLKEETTRNIKESVNDCISNIKSGFGLDWNSKLKDFSTDEKVSLIMKVLKGEIGSYIKDNIKNFVTNLSTAKTTINQAITQAANGFNSSMKSSVTEILTTLKNTINNLFNLDVFYDGNLDATLSDACYALLEAEETPNPYNTFLDGLSQMFRATDDFKKAVNGEGSAIQKFKKALKALKDLLKATKTVASSFKNFVTKTVKQIGDLAKYVATGDFNGLYELFLVSAYVTHSVPNRTNYDSDEAALTGFKYSDIGLRAESNTPSIASGITGLKNTLDAVANGGSDTMFCGAELEFMLAGSKSEIMNQTVAFMNIYMLRLVLDLIPIFTDDAVRLQASAASIAAWVVYLLVIIGEPLCDTILLVNGAKEFIVKKSCYLTPTGIPKLIEKIADLAIEDEDLNNAVNKTVEDKLKKYSNGSTFNSNGMFEAEYETHMLLMMMFTVSIDDILTRFGNIVQLEADNFYKKTDNGGYSFRLNKANTAVESKGEVIFNPFIPVLEINGSSIFNTNFTSCRGY